jgi:antitoxin MazE
MRTRVQKWGNSLAVRIPRSFAVETDLDQGSEVDLVLEEGRLVLSPVKEPRYRLEELLAQVKPAYVHHEVDTGPIVGREIW